MVTRKALVYALLALALAFLANLWATLGYIDHVNGERDRAERAAQQERMAQQERTRALVCRLAAGYAQFYQENPPAPGREGVRDTWAALASQFACPAP